MDQTKGTGGFRLKWLGCACFEMDFGALTVVNDPWITPNKRTELTWEAVERCDYITLTHGHYDHTLDIPALVKRFDPYVLAGENTAVPLMRWADLSPMRVCPMYPGTEMDLDAVKIKAICGRHTVLPGTVNEREAAARKHWEDRNMVELAFWRCRRSMDWA